MTAADRTFVEATAQIIPVLVLALVADQGRRRTIGRSIGTLLGLLAGIEGEGVALYSIVSPSTSSPVALITQCLLILASVIIIPYVSLHSDLLSSRTPAQWKGLLGVDVPAFFYVSLSLALAGPVRNPNWPYWHWVTRGWVALAIALAVFMFVQRRRGWLWVGRHPMHMYSENDVDGYAFYSEIRKWECRGIGIGRYLERQGKTTSWFRSKFDIPKIVAHRVLNLGDPTAPDEVEPSASEQPDDPGVVGEESSEGGVGTGEDGEDGTEEQAHEGNADDDDNGKEKTLNHE